MRNQSVSFSYAFLSLLFAFTQSTVTLKATLQKISKKKTSPGQLWIRYATYCKSWLWMTI